MTMKPSQQTGNAGFYIIPGSLERFIQGFSNVVLLLFFPIFSNLWQEDAFVDMRAANCEECAVGCDDEQIVLEVKVSLR